MSTVFRIISEPEDRACLLRGLLSIALIDGSFMNDFNHLVNTFFQVKGKDMEIHQKIASVTEKSFDLQQAARLMENSEVKTFFFNTAVMLACLDSLSERETEILNTYALAFNFLPKDLLELTENIQYEFSRTDAPFMINSVSMIIRGYLNYLLYNETPIGSYQQMRNLYCLTNGRFNDLLGFIHGYFKPPAKIDSVRSLIGDFSQDRLEDIVDKIDTDGVYIFSEKLPDYLCDQLLDYSLTTRSYPQEIPNSSIFYNKDLPISVKYNFDLKELLENETVQKLVNDPLFSTISRTYMGVEPDFDFAAMWWATSCLGGKPDAVAAQLFHFDLDRFKFLKFFVYLTDVDTNSGPHCFVKGSHRFKPPGLLVDGRIPDYAIEQFFPESNIIEICAPKGTVFIADTLGFHKGKALLSGHRLLFQLEFASDLFGQNY